MDRDDVTALLYAGVLDAEAWQSGLHALAEMCGAHHVIALARGHVPGNAGENTGINLAQAPGSVLSWTARLAEEFLPIVSATGMGTMNFASGLTTGRALPQQALLPDDVFRRTELYADIVRPMGGHHAIIARPCEGSFITFCRPEQADEFKSGDLVHLQSALPALTTVLQLKRHLSLLETRSASIEVALEGADIGILLLDPQRRPFHANAVGERILRAKDGLDWTPAGPVAARESDTKRLRVCVGSATGEPCLLPRPSGKRPLAVRALPIDGGTRSQRYMHAAAGCVAVYIRDPDHQVDRQVTAVAAAFGLTPREATIVSRLAGGMSIAAAALDLEISPGNARVHLKNIFHKTDTHSQAELVRLMLGARI